MPECLLLYARTYTYPEIEYIRDCGIQLLSVEFTVDSSPATEATMRTRKRRNKEACHPFSTSLLCPRSSCVVGNRIQKSVYKRNCFVSLRAQITLGLWVQDGTKTEASRSTGLYARRRTHPKIGDSIFGVFFARFMIQS